MDVNDNIYLKSSVFVIAVGCGHCLDGNDTLCLMFLCSKPAEHTDLETCF